MNSTRSAGARSYERRAPDEGILFQVLNEHLEPFLATAAEAGDGVGVPAFVQKELRNYISCGILAHGFARFSCGSCKFERWVPFSCRGRGFCPSCGGKRMKHAS